jgi:hypothetical protein
LRWIQKHSDELPNSLMPHPNGPDGPVGAEWGPFPHLDDDERQGDFGSPTEDAVIRFQHQAGLDVDGFAGIDTLHQLDPIVAFLEARHLTASGAIDYTS